MDSAGVAMWMTQVFVQRQHVAQAGLVARLALQLSNVSGAFDALTENDFCHICEDAVINMSPYLGSNSSIEFNVNCQKANFNKSFTGRPVMNDDNFLISMSMPATSIYPYYEVTAYVYKNDKGNVRLHGFARHIYYENVVVDFDGTEHKDVKSMVNYYFDVLK